MAKREGGIEMKILTKILISIGFILVMVGGAGMDSPSILLPVIMAFGGLGIMAAGRGLEDAFNV